MRFPFFGSGIMASSNKTVSPRFSVMRNGAAGSMLKNCRFTPDASAARLIWIFSFACVTLLMPTVGLQVSATDTSLEAAKRAGWKNWSDTPAHSST